MNRILLDRLEAADRIAVLGHLHPDGDCIGSTLGLYLYIKKNFPAKEVKVFLEEGDPKFGFLTGFNDIIHEPDTDWKADLAVALDVSDQGRLGDFEPVFLAAEKTFNVDHHVTNPGFADETVCMPDASSACEVLYELLEADKIDKEIAACLYTGMVTDSGVFKYESTSENTMRIAGALMRTGIPFGEIIDEAFYRKSPVQSRILGWALDHAVSELGGKFLWTKISAEVKKAYGADHRDLDGISEQLRLTRGVALSCLISETDQGDWKVSLRASEAVDAAAICSRFGGGGHIRAAGATIKEDPDGAVREIRRLCEAQLDLSETEC